MVRRIGMNGFGRMGRMVLRRLPTVPDVATIPQGVVGPTTVSPSGARGRNKARNYP